MAQLPPKVPNMTPTWSEFTTHQKMSFLKTMTPNMSNQNPSWVDEFVDFSAARRGAHRRAVSDSIAFLETPALDHHCKCRASGDDDNEFERFDDEQFMSMFSDEASGNNNNNTTAPTLSYSNPSTPSDHNSINDEQKMNKEKEEEEEKNQVKSESDEDESQCKQEITETPDDCNNSNANATTCSSEKITDPKRVKRILANRQSAQRSRVRKLQYISELERSVTSLQAEVSVLSPRVAFLDHQRLLLNVDNSTLKQRIAALAQDKIFKDAHQEALKREIERLRQVYHQQNIKNMDNAAGSPSQSPLPSPKPLCDTHTEKEQLINV
ncbi:unnamed protein product [Sphenostylis stenocarpa]|uniref:BZIP domain-containing protein n=1 Tax=Sphenostylis stenocarpa TaxID=92480 RepID=A0AA86W5E8_9FABA|nr:unnamed protein product [Sphenostylis stenocarpa]